MVFAFPQTSFKPSGSFYLFSVLQAHLHSRAQGWVLLRQWRYLQLSASECLPPSCPLSQVPGGSHSPGTLLSSVVLASSLVSVALWRSSSWWPQDSVQEYPSQICQAAALLSAPLAFVVPLSHWACDGETGRCWVSTGSPVYASYKLRPSHSSVTITSSLPLSWYELSQCEADEGSERESEVPKVTQPVVALVLKLRFLWLQIPCPFPENFCLSYLRVVPGGTQAKTKKTFILILINGMSCFISSSYWPPTSYNESFIKPKSVPPYKCILKQSIPLHLFSFLQSLHLNPVTLISSLDYSSASALPSQLVLCIDGKAVFSKSNSDHDIPLLKSKLSPLLAEWKPESSA